MNLTDTNRHRLLYSQCWEDPGLLDNLLTVHEDDDVLSVASAGDNTFALLLHRPRSIVAIDRNPAQLALLELKLKAIRYLDYDEFLRFIGIRPSTDRMGTYAFLRIVLSTGAREYWDREWKMIDRGVIHQGKFERYFRIFRRTLLPLIHGRKTVNRLLDLSDPGEQRKFYRTVWNNRRWRLLFSLFFSRLLLGRLGREHATFRHVDRSDIAGELLRRTFRGFTAIPVRGNYFLEYILTGAYRNPARSHPYINEENFNELKRTVDRVRLVQGDLTSYLESVEPGSISKFNLSDIFEYMSQSEYDACLRGILRAGRAKGRMAYWSLFVPRYPSRELRYSMREISGLPGGTRPPDRTFFYNCCAGWLLHPRTPEIPARVTHFLGVGR